MQRSFKSDIEFNKKKNITSAINFGKLLSNFMIPVALLEMFAS